jgi:hypothetical protein
MNKYAIIVALLAVGLIMHSANADTSIPSWIKSNAKYWKEGQIGDDEYVKGIQYLIQNGVMQIPTSDNVVDKSPTIPSWVKNDAGWWADGSIGDSEYISAMQYLVAAGIINVNQKNTSVQSTSNSTSDDNATSIAQSNISTSDQNNCNTLTTDADKETCLENVQQAQELKDQIAKATPYVVGPVTYYIIGTDLIDTGDGGVFINVNTILENTGSQTSNPDLFCTGPYACNYHLTDGQNDYPPSIFSLTSGHLELRFHDPRPIVWNFYSKENIGGFTFDPSKQYSFKVSESFGSAIIPLTMVRQ